MKIISAIFLMAFGIILLLKSSDSKAPLVPLLNNSLNSEELNSSSDGSEILLNYRLPNETFPEHYDIKITTNIHSGEEAFQGEVVIDIVVVTSTNNIVLHAYQLQIADVIIINPSTGETEELSYEYELEREFLTLKHQSSKNFEAGTKWKLAISYNGQLRDDNLGFYAYSYEDENGKNRPVALTQFASVSARHGFPCYDEPAKRAKFTITINHSSNMTALSNMPINETSSGPGKTVFLTTAPIPTYIVAFVICDFEYTEVNYAGIRQRVYSRSSKIIDHEFSLTIGVLYINYFSEYYGIDYMLPKLDYTAVMQFETGGMENWGLITAPEKNLLYNNKTSLISSKTYVAKVLAHEIAHHWFGDYVTIQWWSTLWLKEGFATLFSYKAMDRVFPEWNIWQHFHVIEYQQSMQVDAEINSRPLTSYVQTPSEISQIYDSISYNKGAAVLIMWQNALGEEVFQRAVKNFLKKNQYSAATEDDFFSEMEYSVAIDNLELPASILDMMKTWMHQGGYPILSVSRNCNNSSFTIKQETFFNDETLSDNKTWYIPINFAVDSNPDFSNTKASHYLLNTKEINIDAQLKLDDWIILNKRSEYFYRIKYDESNYALITQTLNEDPFKIHVRNRAQLLEDAKMLTFSNRLNQEVLLEMMTYLRKEDQYAPWLVSQSIIAQYKKLKDFAEFKNFIMELVRPIFNKLGVDKIPGEHHFDQYTREIVIGIACEAGLRECLVETNKKLKAHIIENVTLGPDFEITIFIHGLRQADDEEFDSVYQKLMEETDEEQRVLLIQFLGFAQNTRHIKKFISSTIDMSNKLLPEERYTILSNVYSNSEESLLTCIEFLYENWDTYGNLPIDYIDINPLNSDIYDMAEYVFNKNVEAKLLGLVEKVKNSKHASTSLESDVKKQFAKNYQWLQEYGESVLTWIRRSYICC